MRESLVNNLRMLDHDQSRQVVAIDDVDRQMRCGAILTLLHLRAMIDARIQKLSSDDAHDWRTVNPTEIAPQYSHDARDLMDSVLYRDFWSEWAHKHDRMWAIHYRRDRAEVLFQFLKQMEEPL